MTRVWSSRNDKGGISMIDTTFVTSPVGLDPSGTGPQGSVRRTVQVDRDKVDVSVGQNDDSLPRRCRT